MPSPMNTPTNENKPKSIFDSIENFTQSKSLMINDNEQLIQTNTQLLESETSDGVNLIPKILEDNSQQNKSSTMSLESVTSLSNSTSSISMDNDQQQQPLQQEQRITTPSNLNPVNEDPMLWHSSSIKYRRARLNLNMLTLKNLSLPQINDNGIGSSQNESSLKSDDLSSNTAASNWNHELTRPPSPKYNPEKFAPIFTLYNDSESNENDSKNLNMDNKRNSNYGTNGSNRYFNYQDAVRINPNLDLEQQEWFHGYISKQEAEQILAPKNVGSYLVRRWKFSYTLSLKSIFGFIHFRIFYCRHNEKWSLGSSCIAHGNENSANKYGTNMIMRQFDSIPQLVDYFTIHRLPLNGCEHMALLYPIAARLL